MSTHLGSTNTVWMSDGTPTTPVRDVGEEAYDPPPEGVALGRLIPAEEKLEDSPDDLLRAGDWDRRPTSQDFVAMGEVQKYRNLPGYAQQR
jgi:hypothetical protein